MRGDCFLEESATLLVQQELKLRLRPVEKVILIFMLQRLFIEAAILFFI